MEESSDSEQDFDAQQDKILLDELARHQSASSGKRRPAAELLPVGLDSDQSSEDDDDEDEEEENEDDDDDAATIKKHRELLKRARLQRLRKDVAEDLGDEDRDEDDDDDEDAGDDRQWAASRRYRYASDDDDEEDAEGDEDDADAAAATSKSAGRLMREERERLRRRLLGVGLPSDLPTSAAPAVSASSTRPKVGDATATAAAAATALVRVASELPAYERPPPGVSLERHLLDGEDRWPDMRRAYELKTRLETQLKPLADRPESALTDRQAAIKWHYILLCSYLRMRAAGVPGLHRHPVRRILRRAGEAICRHLVEGASAAGKRQQVTKPKARPTLDVRKAEEEEAEAEVDAEAEPASQHRPIYWEMQKNQPVQMHRRRRRDAKRKKPGDSNPRVKLRDKFRRAMIKRRSQVPEVRPESTRYSGEMSGIRAGLVKSRKFK